MATTNLGVAIFRVILGRETVQTAWYPKEDFWENGSQTGGDFQGVFPGWAVGYELCDRLQEGPSVFSIKLQRGDLRRSGEQGSSHYILAKAGDIDGEKRLLSGRRSILTQT